MQIAEKDLDSACHVGFGLGLVALLGGLLIGVVHLARPEGFGTAPAVAAEALHLRTRVQLIGGCLVLAATVLSATLRSRRARHGQLALLLVAVLWTSLGSAALAVLLNWAIVTRHAADYLGLLPALLELVAVALYAGLATMVLAGADGPLAVAMLVQNGMAWLLLYAVAQLIWTAGRVFLDNDRLLWFVDTPAMEAGLLGFLVPTGLGLLLGGLPDLSHGRAMLRTVPQAVQTMSICLALWLVLRVWCIRYPGSYQQLVLALVGLGILLCVLKMAEGSGLTDPWRRGGAPQVGRQLAVQALPFSLLFLIAAALLVAVVGVYTAGANRPPPQGLFAALGLSLTWGFFVTLAGPLMVTRIQGRAALSTQTRRRIVVAWSCLAVGSALAAGLWAMTAVVERSLNLLVVGAEGLTAVGVLGLVAWLHSVRARPPTAP